MPNNKMVMDKLRMTLRAPPKPRVEEFNLKTHKFRLEDGETSKTIAFPQLVEEVEKRLREARE